MNAHDGSTLASPRFSHPVIIIAGFHLYLVYLVSAPVTEGKHGAKKLTNKITDPKQRSPNGRNTATKYINYRLFAQVFRVPVYYCGDYFGGMPQEVYDLNMGDIPR